MKVVAFVLGSIPLLIQLYQKDIVEKDRRVTLESLKGDAGIPRVETYDFIVVGGGSAGCVIAARLQENFKVLMLEAGGEPVPASQVPDLVRWVGYAPEINYAFPSVPQRFASQNSGGVIVTHAGKMFGGSGSHNDMVHNRGSPHDYDNFARILNDSSWNYYNVLQYFKKYENFIGELFSGENEGNYGRGGPITVDTDVPGILPTWFKAGEELGYKIGDPNGYQKESFCPMAKAIDKGQRSSSYNKYIKPLMNNPNGNLTVLPFSVATQILIDENKKAYGVAYERHGIPQIALASKEVIVSTGIFSSPLLLMKSGVGPRDQLEAAEIPVVLDLPAVGKNLDDHIMVTLNRITYNSSASQFIPRMPEEKDYIEMLQKYQETGEGIIGHLQEGPQAFIVSPRAKAEGQGEWPDILINFDPMGPAQSAGNLPVSSAYVWNVRPKSRGQLTLNTTAYKNGVRDDQQLALIDFRLFEDGHEDDADVLLEAIDMTLKILNTTAFQALGAKYSAEPLEACSQHAFMSETYWRCYITQTSYTTFHGTGTCSLGSVLDSKFKVQGISNLRVADASVLPVVTNANLNAAILMIAEKAADDITKEWVKDLGSNSQDKARYNTYVLFTIVSLLMVL